MREAERVPEPPEYVPKWTQLLFRLNALIDEGESVGVNEVSDHIQDGTLFQWLAERFPRLDLSLYQPNVLYPAEVMLEVLQRIDNAAGASKFRVSNNGLCQLLAYGLQALQQAE